MQLEDSRFTTEQIEDASNPNEGDHQLILEYGKHIVLDDWPEFAIHQRAIFANSDDTVVITDDAEQFITDCSLISGTYDVTDINVDKTIDNESMTIHYPRGESMTVHHTHGEFSVRLIESVDDLSRFSPELLLIDSQITSRETYDEVAPMSEVEDMNIWFNRPDNLDEVVAQFRPITVY